MGAKCLSKQSLSRGFVGVIALATLLLWLSPAYGRIIVENFDNGDYNHNLFAVNTSGTPNQPTVTVVSEQLQVTISGPITGLFGAGLGMTPNLQLMSNFDIQVDFNLAAWPANNGVGAGIVSQLFDVRRVANNGQTSETYEFGIPGKGITNVTTGDMSGKLRLKRTGSTVQAFYWVPASSSWQSIGSPVTDKTLAAPTSVYIGIYAGGVYGPTAADGDV
jgi:hypothetical protein